MDKPILTSYGLNYWWTIGANEVQFCHRRTNTYLTDLHRALAPVSYTHLDVYKRQEEHLVREKHY